MDRQSTLALPRELQNRLDMIIHTVPYFWEQGLHRYYTNHGPKHSRRVHEKAMDLARQLSENYSLTDDEVFIISAAAWLYEIGLQSPNPGPVLGFDWHPREHLSFQQLLEVRAQKHLVTEQLILDSLRKDYQGPPIYLGLTPPVDDYIHRIIEVCRWCSDEPLEEVPDVMPIHNKSARVRLLVAILRLADQLYIDGERVNLSLLSKYNLPVREFTRWAVYPLIQTLPIENKQIQFYYSLPVSLKDYLGNVRAVVEPSFERTDNPTIRYLWTQGLHLVVHETPIVSLNQLDNLSSDLVLRLAEALQYFLPLRPISIEHAGKNTSGKQLETSNIPSIRTQQEIIPQLSIFLLTTILPTGYCRHLDASNFPFITVHVDNSKSTCKFTVLRVSACIEDYSDTAVTTVTVQPGQETNISLLPLLKQSKIAEVTEIRRTSLRIMVEQLHPSVLMLYDHSEIIRMQAWNTAVLAVANPDGQVIDLTNYLSAWVTPRHPAIEQWLRKAAEYHPNKQFIGYQGAQTISEAREIVREQSRAIFYMLKRDANLTYINSPFSLGADIGQIIQRVRLPRESLSTGGSANCIDGTVLFASFLELVGIDPLIVVVPGHAFIGWKIWKNSDIFEFLETTMIRSDNFDTAQKVAMDTYISIPKAYFGHSPFDPDGFARIIDVAKCRATGIYPVE